MSVTTDGSRVRRRPVPRDAAPTRAHGWRAFAVRLIFELLVVFAGVYSAFTLAEHERVRELEERRE